MRDGGLGRLALLTSAIGGRRLEVDATEPGQPAWTDGATVFVDGGATPADQLCSVAVQASLLSAGSLDTDIIRQLARRASVARRYLAVEGHRALAAQEPFLPPSVGLLIDRNMAGRSDSPAASLAVAGSREVIDEPPPLFGTIRPRDMCTVNRGAGASVAQHVPRLDRVGSLRELDDGQEDEQEPLVFDISSPVGGGGTIGRLLKRLLSDRRASPAHGARPSIEESTHVATRSRGGARRVASGAFRATTTYDPGIVAARGMTYPEWDVFQRRYRHDWCTVLEVDPDIDGRGRMAPPHTQTLRPPLARLRMDFERRHRQLEGDEIDVDAAVEARVELAAGSAPDEAVYVDSVRGRRDLAVLVLLDVSGSAGEPSATGVPVHEHQRAAAAALTMALHELGDRVALYAFRSHGRTAVSVLPVKRFADNMDARVMRRLSGLVPGAYTRVGAAIRHGARVLEHGGGTARRLLVVLSDGFAYDHGYEGAYGEADARRALAEARRRGTGCLCLSIGAATDPEDLRRVFGTAAHATIPGADQLAGVIGPLFRSALGAAEVQRHMSQRKERTRGLLDLERRTA